MTRPVIGLQEAMFKIRKHMPKQVLGDKNYAKELMYEALVICSYYQYDIEVMVGELMEELEEESCQN